MALSEKYPQDLFAKTRGEEQRYVAVSVPESTLQSIVNHISMLQPSAFAGKSDQAHFLEAAKAALEDNRVWPSNIGGISLGLTNGSVVLEHGESPWQRHFTTFESPRSTLEAQALFQPLLPPEFWAHWNECMAMLQDYASDHRTVRIGPRSVASNPHKEDDDAFPRP